MYIWGVLERLSAGREARFIQLGLMAHRPQVHVLWRACAWALHVVLYAAQPLWLPARACGWGCQAWALSCS